MALRAPVNNTLAKKNMNFLSIHIMEARIRRFFVSRMVNETHAGKKRGKSGAKWMQK